jgi:hypothetical protein
LKGFELGADKHFERQHNGESVMTDQAIDDVLVATFPASDPPAWTPGIARPAPLVSHRHALSRLRREERRRKRRPVAGGSRHGDYR